MEYETHFLKRPKKEIQKIKDRFQAQQEDKLRPIDEIKNFTAMANEVFDMFEQLSGRRVNREPMKSYVYKYFDEGFEPEAMKAYLKLQIREPYFQENPTAFSIANLFPKDDNEKFQRAWDKMEFARVMLLNTGEKKSKMFEGLTMVRKDCRHLQLVASFRRNDLCPECGAF